MVGIPRNVNARFFLLIHLLFVVKGAVKGGDDGEDSPVWLVLGCVSAVLLCAIIIGVIVGVVICRRQEAINRQHEEYAAGCLNRVPPTVTLEPKAGVEYA